MRKRTPEATVSVFSWGQFFKCVHGMRINVPRRARPPIDVADRSVLQLCIQCARGNDGEISCLVEPRQRRATTLAKAGGVVLAVFGFIAPDTLLPLGPLKLLRRAEDVAGVSAASELSALGTVTVLKTLERRSS